MKNKIQIDFSDTNWELLDKMLNRFQIDFSLQYPENAVLHLEEFANFYFRDDDLKDISFSKRRQLAYNDAMSAGIHEIFTPTKKRYDSMEEFYKDKKEIIKEYGIKALFSQQASKYYVRSGKSAQESLDYEMKNLDRKLMKSIPGKNGEFLELWVYNYIKECILS